MNQEQQPPQPPQPLSLPDLIRVIADKVDPLIKLYETAVRERREGQKLEANFQKHMSWMATVVVLAIVGVAAFLTYKGKVDGSTFTFLLGLIVGYVLTFIRDQITGSDS